MDKDYTYTPNLIIVIGGSHHNTLGVVRSLGQRGYQVDLITIGNSEERYVSSSKYVTTHKALENVALLPDYLRLRSNTIAGHKDVVISCSDVVTEYLNKYRDDLSLKYILPGNPVQGEMERLMDKTTMIEMAARRGLNAPTVWELPDEAENVTFPLITKCHVSSHGGKADVKVIRDEESFRHFLSCNNDHLFAQQFVIKKEEVQFIGCSLNGGETVVIPGMSRILRSQPNTNTGFLEYVPIDPFYEETVERSKRYIKDCNYSGLFSIEFLRSQDDNVYFLEINFRNDGNAWCVTSSGVNLPVIWYKACMGMDYREEVKTVNPIIMMPEFQDFKLVIQRKVGLIGWLKDVRRTNVFVDYDKQDKRPFWHFILHKAHLI